MRRNKRLIAAALIAAVIAGVFWSQSRIPALNEKAQMGLRTNFGEIAFEIALPVTPDQGVAERVFRTTVNWGYTNLQGMTFGLLFAAAILTIFANLRRRQFRSAWMNSLSGVFIGAPLGVCVNCATPIAFGIYSAGARLETALASLIASPTLNAIVLTMAFTLLPWEMALAKTAGVVLMIVLIPFLVRSFAAAPDIDSANQLAARSAGRLPVLNETLPAPEGENLAVATIEALRQFAANLWFLVRFALPLMILAGFLGAVVIEFIPFDTFSGNASGVVALFAGALVACFLPVPIAFDVIIVMALLSNGLNAGLATTLLFGLGIYSVYPATMIARYISPKLSIAFGGVIVVIAIFAGVIVQYWIGYRTEVETQTISAGLVQSRGELLADAAGICDELPGELAPICFSRHIGDFLTAEPDLPVCDVRPATMDAATCASLVARETQTSLAISAMSTEACDEIVDGSGRNQCVYAVILRTAQRDYDIRRCDVLPDASAVARCHADYLNASLLFNPDDSACRGLTGASLEECRVNAEIYRHADTLNIAACDTLLPETARDHCRYTIASTMIGRHDDVSGCAAIEATELAARCEALPTAWRAARNADYGLCEQLADVGLRGTCLMRIADRKIESVLAMSLAGALVPDSMAGDLAIVPADTVQAPTVDSVRLPGQRPGIEILYSAHQARIGDSGQFRQVQAEALGIAHAWTFSITDFFEPFIIGKGIASGDFNNDQWPDLVLATESGIRIYKNTGGQFALSPAVQHELGNANVFLVAFVDLDGDGWQDIFATTYGGVNYGLRNVDGSFERATLLTLPGDHRLTLSAGFGDLDSDGSLDIVLGNWSSGLEKLFATDQSANVVMLHTGTSYEEKSLAGISGETNSVLISDINADDHPDVLIGNDRLVPDLYYLGDGTGNLQPMAKGDMPVTSMFTMSLDAADFNNDLQIDLFSTDMTFARSSRDNYCAPIANDAERARCNELLDVYRLIQDGGAAACNELSGPADRQACFSVFSVRAAKSLQNPQFCANLPERPAATRSLCDYLANPAVASDPVDQSAYTPQTQRNTLLLGAATGFTEHAEALGVSSSYWSWNAKAADLDNDGWQDIYVGNGFHFGENFFEIQENILFRNVGGKRFTEVQADWGLDDPVNTPSYTYLDLDLDGDLDVVATGVIAGPRVFVNELTAGQSIGVALNDERGNRFAIGAVVTISSGSDNALRQQKEVRLSGGFLSFDNPVLYFGVGEAKVVDEISIKWPDGDVTQIPGPLEASGTYQISRRALR
jgi:uncharacterized membrane protein YraQ (UPF0718 family)